MKGGRHGLDTLWKIGKKYDMKDDTISSSLNPSETTKLQLQIPYKRQEITNIYSVYIIYIKLHVQNSSERGNS